MKFFESRISKNLTARRQSHFLNHFQLYKKYGAIDFTQNYNIYKRIAVDLFATSTTEDRDGKAYQLWAALRDMLHDLVGFLCHH